jgi:arginine/lysine/ornithine decarboxylase
MQAGADIAIQSTHKTLAALTQASMLHLQGDRVDPDRVSRSLSLIQSTSPNYLLLASLDAAREQMATTGTATLDTTLKLADQTRNRLNTIPQITTIDFTTPQPGFHHLDRTRLTVTVSQLGIDGFTADAILTNEYHVVCELPSLEHLTFIFSIGSTAEQSDRLIAAIQALTHHAQPIKPGIQPQSYSPGQSKLSPREAFFASARTVPIDQAIGQVSAELICPYPPGIPVLLPGEVITIEAIALLQTVKRSGGVISGCSDADLRTIKVIAA